MEKYYEITMEGDKIKVNTEASDIGEQTTPPAPTITLNKRKYNNSRIRRKRNNKSNF